MLVVADAVGRGVDDFVVRPFRLELFDQFEDRFALHNHSRLAAERIVVGGLAAVVGVVVQVVDDDFDQPFVLRPLENRLVERRGQEFGNRGDDVNAHGDS